MSSLRSSLVIFNAQCQWSWAPPITSSEHRPTDLLMTQYFSAGGKTWTGASNNTIHWCGLFSLYVLKLAGVACSWSGGIIPAGNQLVRHTMPSSISQFPGVHIGDVVVRSDPTSGEHFIVIAQEVPPGKHSYSIWAVDGNSTGNPKDPRVRFSNNWKHTTEKFKYWYSVEY
jgi:hypothetical protein